MFRFVVRRGQSWSAHAARVPLSPKTLKMGFFWENYLLSEKNSKIISERIYRDTDLCFVGYSNFTDIVHRAVQRNDALFC